MGRKPKLPDQVRQKINRSRFKVTMGPLTGVVDRSVRKVEKKAKVKKKSVALVPLEKIKEKFLGMWSDPLDIRTEEEMAYDLDVELTQLRDWRRDPSFYEVATERFKVTFNANLIPVLRNLVDQAIRYKSLAASKVLLQVLGVIQDKGTMINVFQGGNGGGENPASKLDDDALDREINRLSGEVYPIDVRMHNQKIYPIEDACVLEEGEVDA